MSRTIHPGSDSFRPQSLSRYLRPAGQGLFGLLAFVGLALVALPVVLLPLATSVPAPVWALLALVDVGVIVFSLRTWRVGRALVTALMAALVVAVLSVEASQAWASTPPIVDAGGRPVAGSIAALERVTLNDSEQWITLRGRDTRMPVLLFLAGGPGGTDLGVTRHALGGLEEHFVVVNWDQPGAGKSFDAVPRSTLTPQRYVADGLALISYLRRRFGVQKVYLVGESWGSALGVLMVQRSPEQFYAFFGTGQMVAFKENDILCYEFALRWARERGDLAKVDSLERQGPPPYYGAGVAQKQALFLLDTFAYMNENPAVLRAGNTIRDIASQEYGLYDKVSYVRGVLDTLDVVYPQLWEVDFRRQASRLEIPIFFLIGRHDVNAPPALAEEYYRVLTAPQKEIVWFERSGHNPWISEPDAFVDAIVSRALQPSPRGSHLP